MRTSISAAIAIITAMTATGCHNSKSTDNDASQAPVIDVAEATQKSVVLYKQYPGKLHARSTVDLVARVSGYLRSQNYNDGDLVEKGAVLFTIEDTQYRDAVTQAASSLKSAEAELQYNTAHYDAVKKAAEADAASRMEVEQARSAMESSQQAVNTARAALSTAQSNLGYCTVRAPFKGHVNASTYSVGNYLAGEGSPVKLATIYDDSQVRADFFIDDASYIDMLHKTGREIVTDRDHMPVTFSDELPHSYTGRLTYIAPDIDPTTGTLELRAEIDNPYDELREGMYANIRLPYAADSAAVLVKDASISTDQRGKFLYVVNDSDKVIYTPVEVGDVVDDSLRVITSGLQPGERYVTVGLLKVRPHMTVKPRLVK